MTRIPPFPLGRWVPSNRPTSPLSHAMLPRAAVATWPHPSKLNWVWFLCVHRNAWGVCLGHVSTQHQATIYIWRMNLPTWVWMSCFCPEIHKEQEFHKKDCTVLIIGHSSTNFPDSQGMLGTTGSPRRKSRHERNRLIRSHFGRLESREDEVV